MMIGTLPKTLLVGGVKRPIESDYRVALNLFVYLKRDDITDIDKAYLTVKTLYNCEIADADFAEAVKKGYWFLSGGDIPKSKPIGNRPMIDWEHDAPMIFPAISRVAGCEVRALPYMHLWTFLGYMGEISEGLWTTIVNIRYKMATGKKLEKHEKEFLQRHKEMVVIRSEEDKRAIAETEEFLKQFE